MTGYIYKIVSPTGRIYIGQTTNIKKRFDSYRLLHCKTQRKLYNSLKKYGWENHKVDIIYRIHNSNKELLYKLEIIFIAEFNTYYYDNEFYGLNLTKGGDTKSDYQKYCLSKSITGRKLSEEHKKKIGDSKRGIARPKWLMDKLVEISKSRIWTIEERKAQSNRMKNYKPSEETKKKIAEAHKGKERSAETKRKLSEYWTGYKWDSVRNNKLSIANKGSKNPNAKLTEDIVLNIKRDIWLGIKRGTTLKEFNITNAIYDNIKSGKQWKNVQYIPE